MSDNNTKESTSIEGSIRGIDAGEEFDLGPATIKAYVGTNLVSRTVADEDGFFELDVSKYFEGDIVVDITNFKKNGESYYCGGKKEYRKGDGSIDFMFDFDDAVKSNINNKDLYLLYGTKESDYKPVSNIYMLQGIKDNTSGIYKQVSSFQAYVTDAWKNSFEPITGFSGLYDGQDFTIQGVQLNGNSLFEDLDKRGTVKNIDVIEYSDNSFGVSDEHIIDKDNEDNLLGGLDIYSTSNIDYPEKLVDQVIGQDRARRIIKKAAQQHRHVMMIGSPGTGKSMLAKSMTEMMPNEDLSDIILYPNEDDENNPLVREVPAGEGEKIVEAHNKNNKKKDRAKKIIVAIVMLLVLGYTIFTSTNLLFGLITIVIIGFLYSYVSTQSEDNSPRLLIDRSEQDKAPFEDATGAHDGALLGDVRHDPFQSGGMGTPAHQRVESGAIHKSDNGVLFIDEINTLSVESQQKLMTAIQDGEFQITGQSERSSGAMVQTEPVPTDFVLVAAGNMDAIENMHPAIRDRIEGYGYEVYMDEKMEDTPENRRKLVRFIAQEVDRDGMIPHFRHDAIEEIILEAKRRAGEKNKLTLKLRNLGGLVRNAGDIAREEYNSYEDGLVTREHVLEAKSLDKSIEQQYVKKSVEKKQKYSQVSGDNSSVGRVNGLAVMGDDSGILLPIMSKVSESQQKDKGEIIATGKLQDIAQEAVENVSAIIKDIPDNNDLTQKDIHVQFVQTYEGVQGDSASITVATAIISALENIPVRSDIAMTGSLSVRGDVLPVGGVTHKIEAAAKSEIDTVIIPKVNEDDVMIEDEYKDEIEIITVSNIYEVLDIALKDSQEKDEFLNDLSSLEIMHSNE